MVSIISILCYIIVWYIDIRDTVVRDIIIRNTDIWDTIVQGTDVWDARIVEKTGTDTQNF